jgi:sigma-B regulation protein RsbU (phosphoserine phosphatase)
LELAGAHEDPLLFRRRTGRCERLKTPGFWLAAVEDVSAVTTDLEAQLEDGDVLVLYTDGITESMNETHSQFGLERLVAVIERHGTDSPGKICDAIVLSLTAWSTTQMDDVSLLVAKYAASTRAAEI